MQEYYNYKLIFKARINFQWSSSSVGYHVKKKVAELPCSDIVKPKKIAFIRRVMTLSIVLIVNPNAVVY